MRVAMNKERDEEIEMVISRFEEESVKGEKDRQKAHEDKINSMKSSHVSQLNEVLNRNIMKGMMLMLLCSLKNQRRAGKPSTWNRLRMPMRRMKRLLS